MRNLTRNNSAVKILKACFIVLLISFSNNLIAQDLSIKCSDCSPILGCNRCFKTQEEADEYCELVTTVEEKMEHASVDVFPNPAPSEGFYVNNVNNIEGIITIYSQNGVIVARHALSAHESQVYIHNQLKPGMYFLEIENEKNEVRARQLLFIIDQ